MLPLLPVITLPSALPVPSSQATGAQEQLLHVVGQHPVDRRVGGVKALVRRLDGHVAAAVDEVDVVAGAADQPVRPGPAVQRVVAAEAPERVVRRRAGHVVVARGADDPVQRRRRRRRRAVGEQQVARGQIGGGQALQQDQVARRQGDQHALGGVGDRRGGGMTLDPQHLGRRTRREVADPVVAVARAEHEGVLTLAAQKAVVAGPAGESVRSAAPVQPVVAAEAGQGIAAPVAGKPIIEERPGQIGDAGQIEPRTDAGTVQVEFGLERIDPQIGDDAISRQAGVQADIHRWIGHVGHGQHAHIDKRHVEPLARQTLHKPGQRLS